MVHNFCHDKTEVAVTLILIQIELEKMYMRMIVFTEFLLMLTVSKSEYNFGKGWVRTKIMY